MKNSIQTRPKNQKKREKTPHKLDHKTKREEREREQEETKKKKTKQRTYQDHLCICPWQGVTSSKNGTDLIAKIIEKRCRHYFPPPPPLNRMQN
jgi:hypothetical protein